MFFFFCSLRTVVLCPDNETVVGLPVLCCAVEILANKFNYYWHVYTCLVILQ
jgi:hypothetical protein